MIAILTLAATLAGTSHSHACHPIDGDRIQMRDLAQADARFASSDLELLVGSSPEPGAARVFWPTELIRIAERNGIVTDAPFHQVCFERRTGLLTPEKVIAAIREWAPAAATIEVMELSKFPVPLGDLIMRRPQVTQPAEDKSILIRGYVRFGAVQRFPVWARVRVVSKVKLVIPLEDIIAGSEIAPSQVRTEERDGGLEALQFAAEIEQVAGHVARRRIMAGKPIVLAALEETKPVMRGALVKVEVMAGAAHLSLDGLAQRSGRTGEMVTIRNPSSGKEFQARVTGENTVVVIASGTNFQGTDLK